MLLSHPKTWLLLPLCLSASARPLCADDLPRGLDKPSVAPEVPAGVINYRLGPDRAINPIDEGGFFTADSFGPIYTAIHDLYRRYGCQVVLETYPKIPHDIAAGVNLRDPAASDKVLREWAEECLGRLNPRNLRVVIIAVRREGRTVVATRWGGVPKDVGDKFGAELTEAVRTRGVAEALKYAADALGARPIDPDRATAGRSAAAPENQRLPTKNDGNAAADYAAFRRAAKDGGLSAEEVAVILRERGPVSCKQLAAFVTEQMMEGRRGKDLKEDVDYFIKVYKEKIGQ